MGEEGENSERSSARGGVGTSKPSAILAFEAKISACVEPKKGSTHAIRDETVVGGCRISWLSGQELLESSGLDSVESRRGELGRAGAEDVTVTGYSLCVVEVVRFCLSCTKKGENAYEKDAAGGEAGSDPLVDRSLHRACDEKRRVSWAVEL